MTRRVSATMAKAQLSALLGEVAFRGSRVVIERRGKPIAALVSLEELERIETDQGTVEHPRGALALVGAWREAGDDHIEALAAEIYAARDKDKGRAVEIAP